MPDLEYEENNRVVNQFGGEEIKCKNFELCNSSMSLEGFIYGNYICMTCDESCLGFGWNELQFRAAHEGVDCAVCGLSSRQMKFPANCGHWFCVGCSKKILFWDETRYHLSPVTWGCPRCPKGCDNPVRGRQCYCEEYDTVQDQWSEDRPDQYDAWKTAENRSINESPEEAGSAFGSKKCPLCRSNYTRPGWSS